jgi:hypothetical protein
MNPQELLKDRQRFTDRLSDNPYNARTYLFRADSYLALGFPDLAAGDAYKALLLTDEAIDASGEYHEQAQDALSPAWENEYGSVEEYAKELALKAYQRLSRSLRKCGCCRSAYEFCERGLVLDPEDSWLQDEKDLLMAMAKPVDGKPFDPLALPTQGSARRELYPWNNYEPDRFSSDTLAILNTEMALVAPKCEVLTTELPLLTVDGSPDPAGTKVKQLGIFAKDDINPGETVLHESSSLTANNRLHDPLCDACSSELPSISSSQQLHPCPNCDDTVFCSQDCLQTASTKYHPSICGKDIDSIGKDTPAKEAADALYLLLLGRVFALSSTQKIHPLLLKETKYIWGDFIHPDSTYVHSANASAFTTARHLPFSFTYNILSPLHILEKMDVDIYKSLADYDFWILNTLYAKFRGTANARISTRDGRPEVSAVHPMWCLANHSCAPNVRWEWGGEIKFWARAGDEVVRWGPDKEDEGTGRWRGGIKKGDEVMSHYCDPELGVEARREWAAGPLGGMCTCARCTWEAKQGRR